MKPVWIFGRDQLPVVGELAFDEPGRERLSGDAFLTEPAAGAGRAMQAGAQPPVLDQEFDSATLYALRAAVQAHVGQAGLSEDRVGEVRREVARVLGRSGLARRSSSGVAML